MRMVTEDREESTAQALQMVSGYMVAACQQAIYDVALDDTGDPAVRHEAIATLRRILQDWREARKALRDELASERPTFTSR